MIDWVRAALFTPGNRPERFVKGAATGADALILDLEDAVAASGKAGARDTVISHFAGPFRSALAPGQLAGLRVNNLHTPAGLKDLDALVSARVVPDFIVIPKVESAIEVGVYTRLLDGPQAGIPLVCTIESARGLAAAAEVASADPRVRALAFGGADLAADLRCGMSWEALLLARLQLVQAAAAADIGLLDVPHLALDDEAGLRAHCARVLELGYTGKLAIHPRQVEPIQTGFAPTAVEIDRAAAMVAALERAGGHVVEYEGQMLEGPIARAAHRVLARASRGRVAGA
jgi:citrate lyase beta subunit